METEQIVGAVKLNPHHGHHIVAPLNPSVFEMHRGLGALHRLPHHKRPVHTQKFNTKAVHGYFGDEDSTIYETIYDDLSLDRIIHKSGADKFVVQDGVRT